MIAENKQEFFEQLERELQKLGVEDRTELMSDLEEHFAEGERRGEPESDICRELGNIAEIARSCLDLKSTAINSMVARDVERKKGVSLTKPGRSVPADPSLAAPESAAEPVRSYTPEHIYEESIPGTPQGVADTSANETANVFEGNTSNSSVGSSVGEAANGSVNSASDSSANGTAGGSSAPNGGTFEKIGKTVDGVCEKAGKALNNALNKAGTAVNSAASKAGAAAQAFRPSDEYRKNINNRRRGSDVPPQFSKVKTEGGGKFIDTSGLKPNVNPARLVVEILLDIFLWIWLIIAIFAVAVAVFSCAAGLVGAGVACVAGWSDFAQFKLPTRVLFLMGFLSLSGAVFCLAAFIAKGAASLTGHVIKRHIKAVYNV